MKIGIRRNLDLKFDLKMSNDNKMAIEQLFKDIPRLTEEQKAMIDESERNRKALEEEIWDYLDKNETLDLNGDVIRRETHEICYETDVESDENGVLCMAVVKEIYVRPQKSEYEGGYLNWRNSGN